MQLLIQHFSQLYVQFQETGEHYLVTVGVVTITSYCHFDQHVCSIQHVGLLSLGDGDKKESVVGYLEIQNQILVYLCPVIS